jgi:hypothetical protein
MSFDLKIELPRISIFHSPSSIRYPASMFETIATEITTAADKLTHLRRFL